MLTRISDAAGAPLDAKVDVEDGAIIVHSRGGAFGKPNLRNPDHRKALSLIVERLKRSDAIDNVTGVWLDSRIALTWPEDERRLLEASEFALPAGDIVTLIGQRGAAKGRAEGTFGHGNSTKRVKFLVPHVSAHELQQIIGGPVDENKRVPSSVQRRVTGEMIDEAVARLMRGEPHPFYDSIEYDVLLPTGDRLPPKAVFGFALASVVGRPTKPTDFSAGWGQPCFSIIEEAGYPIVAKGESFPPPDADQDDERSWAEGDRRRVQHLRRERAPGLASAKKRRFIEEHGFLFCERCGVIPSRALGPHGDACIEVHHETIFVAKMDGVTRTRLNDLKCLCANCHRIIHRERL
ncbi:hypothetical protein [Mesorhizobium sp. M2A.F.Ca.ET.043.02.1.1]|uniref:HNH endonuclease n=1 Tax=Mesorhizobium sp. M2A.F.Ca.ET.043.02.1.1 TaxID=2493670 RepID=UPI000F751AB1|nr:hypothetical protein [Mesorhizobium sp. M2A.F.Ca.ET.043.02.1.1]AZO04337.1 hypothetical protein EJ068_15620 [Mesorhizobium sp. M2A.F.Ca.ET.043.02.1.1]